MNTKKFNTTKAFEEQQGEKIIVTADDLLNNYGLLEAGVKEGDEITIYPEPATPNPQPPTDPYAPKVEEWFTESATDETLGIETIIYANGNKSKRCTLSTGAVATCHRLKASSRKIMERIADEKSGHSRQDAVTILSSKINDKAMVIEDLDNMWLNDFTSLQTMAVSINFL